jgi:YfiH family protein
VQFTNVKNYSLHRVHLRTVFKMKKINIGTLELWQFENLSNEKNVGHFVSDRNAVLHRSDFTLSLSSSPDKNFVKNNRGLIAASMGIDSNKLFFPSQVHQTRIVNVNSNIQRDALLDTDALITSERGVCIAVMSADCVPIILYDKKNQAVAAVHSGWKGTVAKILTKTLAEMNRVFNTDGKDLIAGIGPSVSVDSYEVGEEVIDAVEKSFTTSSELLVGLANGKAKLDLWKANIQQLIEFGVPMKSIEVSNLCTIKNNIDFFSARKGDSGRFAAGIMLR